jgi:hypothetical protein
MDDYDAGNSSPNTDGFYIPLITPLLWILMHVAFWGVLIVFTLVVLDQIFIEPFRQRRRH